LTSFKKAYDRCDTVTRAGRTCPQRGGSAPIVLTMRTLHYTFNIGKLEDKSVFFYPFLLYLLLFTGSVMIVFLGFYYFPDTIPGIVLHPPKKGDFSTKKYWYLYK
jgi:hypothetical protein